MYTAPWRGLCASTEVKREVFTNLTCAHAQGAWIVHSVALGAEGHPDSGACVP